MAVHWHMLTLTALCLLSLSAHAFAAKGVVQRAGAAGEGHRRTGERR